MKKWIVVVIAVLVLLGTGGWWFWSLAAVPGEAAPQVTLKVDRPPVMVRRPNSTAFEEATSGMTLSSGWTVKTGESAQATLTFFRQAESRLDQNSEVTITDATQDENDPTKTVVTLDLGLGRIWSRVLRLFDLDSRYSVKTSSVVATVRGTAFDVQAKADKSAEVWVSESAVTVSPSRTADGDGAFTYDDGRVISTLDARAGATSAAALAEGTSAVYDASGKVVARRELSADDRSGRWFMTNAISDKAFVSAERDSRREELKKLGGTRPDSPWDGLAQLSEKLHIAFASDATRDPLAERYLARRLAQLIELAETGKAGLASQEFARLENTIRTRLRGASGARERKRIKVALARVAILVDDASPSSALYPLKQRIENLASSLMEEDRAALFFTRLLAADSRLDEASRFLDESALEEARTALDAAKAGIENVERDAKPVVSELEERQKISLLGKIFALRVREEAERDRLRTALREPAVEAAPTSTEPTVATSTAPARTPPPPAPPAPPGTVPPPAGAPAYSGVSAFIQPNPISVDQSASLTVLATRTGGGQDNVTARSTFSVVSGQGGLNGPTFTGTVAGSVTIQATYLDNGTTHTAKVTLNVTGVATLQSLVLSSTNGTSLDRYTKSSTQIQAFAKYSDGYQKTVTNLTTFTNSNPAAGTLSGSAFTASFGQTAGGTVTTDVEGTFTENGKTVIGTIMLTVQQ